MNKKLTLGIGVCALAFGAVAAVISTRAIEAKADITWIGLSATVDGTSDWGWTDFAWSSEDNGYVVTKEFSKNGAFNIKYWDGEDHWCNNKWFVTGEVADGWAADGNNAVYSGEETKTFKITAINPHDDWVDLKIAEVDSPEPEPFVIESWGLVGSENDWAETAGSTFTYDSVNKVYTLEYDAAVDEEFKIRANGKWANEGSVELWWQFCDKFNQDGKLHKGETNAQFKVAKTFIFTIKDTLTPEIAGDWEQVGDYIDVSIKGERADGYYVVGLGNDWTTASAIGSETLEDGNKFQKTGIAMTHGDEFKIVAIKDNAIDWDDKIVVAPTKAKSENDQSANYVTVDDHNNGISLKAIASGTFDVYVNSTSEIYIVGTAEERAPAKEVDEFIDDFITPNVTNPDDKGKYETWESCADKYTTATTVLDRLSAQAKNLFLTDTGVSSKIETARASYVWWRDHKDNGGAKIVAPLSTKTTAIITVGSVIAIGAILAGSMIYFSRKKKQN